MFFQKYTIFFTLPKKTFREYTFSFYIYGKAFLKVYFYTSRKIVLEVNFYTSKKIIPKVNFYTPKNWLFE